MGDCARTTARPAAPLVVNDLVIAGVSGGDEGIRRLPRCLQGLDREHVWRFWTIPAAVSLAPKRGSGARSNMAAAPRGLPAPNDPEAKLLYWPTGNPCPDYNGDERKGDNLYTASVVALDPATGKLKMVLPVHATRPARLDATETPVLVDANFRGQPRKLLLQEIATASSTCSTASPAKCWWPSRSSRN